MLGIIIDLKHKSNTFQNFLEWLSTGKLLNKTRTLRKKNSENFEIYAKAYNRKFRNILIDMFYYNKHTINLRFSEKLLKTELSSFVQPNSNTTKYFRKLKDLSNIATAKI